MRRTQRLEKQSKQTITVFNPLDEDFIVNWDSKPLKPAKKLDFTDYPYHEGIHVKKHLKIEVANKRKIHPFNKEALDEIEKEISDVK